MRFTIDPVRAFLVLEADGQLVEHIDEASPLRRFKSESEGDVFVPVIWDSRVLEEHQKNSPAQTNRKRKAKGTPPEMPKLIYVARKGSSFDGHSLAEEVLSAGNIFVGEYKNVEAQLKSKNCPKEWIRQVLTHPLFIKVRSSEYSLCRILEAASGLQPDGFTTIAVTGTNGKTSVTQIAASLLRQVVKKNILKLGTLGIEVGELKKEGVNPTMPDFPEFLSAVSDARNADISHIVLEATSHGLVQKRLGNWLVDVGVFTNLTQDHLDYHGTMQAYRDAKTLLFERHVKHGGTVVINTDDPLWEHFAQRASHPYRNCIGVGRGKNKKAFFKKFDGKFMSVRYLEIANSLVLRTGIQGTWSLQNDKTVLEESNFSCRLVGAFQHDNLAFSAAALVGLGYPLNQVAQAVTHVGSIPGRLELVTFPGMSEGKTPTVLVDYAHSPDALQKTLQTCRELKGKKGRLFCVFGCGGDRDKTKRPLMGRIGSELADVCVVTSDNPRTEEPQAIVSDIVSGVSKGKKPVTMIDRREAIQFAVESANQDDLVVIAGKGHENYQIIGTKKIDFSDVEVARASLLAKMNQFP